MTHPFDHVVLNIFMKQLFLFVLHISGYKTSLLNSLPLY